MKYLKRIFESTTKEELQDFCETNLAYLNRDYKIRIEEGVFDYFSKESKDKRSKIKEIKEGIIKLINSYKLRIDNNWGSAFKGNTQLNTKYGKFWININDNFSVDVIGNVSIRLGRDVKNFPCKFNRIDGNFFIELSFGINNFISKFPEKVEGKLSITNCGLYSLKNLPTKYVGKDFNCSYNNLLTLDGLPEHILGNINADSNDIYTYEFLENFKGDISLYLNPIQYIKFHEHEHQRNYYSYHTLQELLINDEYYDLFKSCDPIHPPAKQGGLPTIYMIRMNAFADELNMKFDITNSVNKYYITK